MKVAGIIAEYNPFHNGHLYQINEIRKKTDADYIIVAMSGNFVQRGEPAIVDKYTRSKMALLGGVDLVIEIPAIWATASSEHFAKAGVSILSNTCCVNNLCFGAETDSLETFSKYANLLLSENTVISDEIAARTKAGVPYPKARLDSYKKNYANLFPEDFWEQLNMPNNILAIEYLKALTLISPAIIPVLIQRKGDNYNDTTVRSLKASASAIRQLIKSNVSYEDYIPEAALKVLDEHLLHNNAIFPDDISSLLIYKLLCEESNGYTGFADCSDTLSATIISKLSDYRSFTQFTELVKSKNYTYTRITRTLLHILLDIYSSDYDSISTCGYAPYLRVLGFNKEAQPLLHKIKKEATVPLITKVADASSILNYDSYKLFKKDIFISNIYNTINPSNGFSKQANEFTHGPVII